MGESEDIEKPLIIICYSQCDKRVPTGLLLHLHLQVSLSSPACIKTNLTRCSIFCVQVCNIVRLFWSLIL